jgi:hypothetical protein
MVDHGNRVMGKFRGDSSPQMSTVIEEFTLEISNLRQCGRLVGWLQCGTTEATPGRFMARTIRSLPVVILH